MMKNKDKYKELLDAGNTDLVIALMRGDDIPRVKIANFLMKHYEVRNEIQKVNYYHTFRLSILNEVLQFTVHDVMVGNRWKKQWVIEKLTEYNNEYNYTFTTILRRFGNGKGFKSEAKNWIKAWLIRHIKENYG